MMPPSYVILFHSSVTRLRLHSFGFLKLSPQSGVPLFSCHRDENFPSSNSLKLSRPLTADSRPPKSPDTKTFLGFTNYETNE